MAPSKGAKRKSDSPHTEGVEIKRYSTRSSSRKAISYKEGDDGEVSEAPPKTVSSSDDDDFVIEDKKTNYEKEKKESPPSTTTSRANKKNAKQMAASLSNAPKKESGRLPPAIPLNIGFKPVRFDVMKMKSELDLSDSSDSDSPSSNEENCFKTPHSKPICETDLELASSLCKKLDQEQGPSVFKNEFVEESDRVNPWTQNLEALKGNSGRLLEAKSPKIAKDQTKKGKKIKPVSKKSQRVLKKNVQTDESSVAEMLEEEKAKDSSSSESDDENWEKVKAPSIAVEQERELPKSVEITLELSGLKKKKKGLDVENVIRLKINRIRREIQLVCTLTT